MGSGLATMALAQFVSNDFPEVRIMILDLIIAFVILQCLRVLGIWLLGFLIDHGIIGSHPAMRP